MFSNVVSCSRRKNEYLLSKGLIIQSRHNKNDNLVWVDLFLIIAIDVWMAMCLGFVFLALVQFAYVNVLSRVEKRRKLTTMENMRVDSVVSEVDVDKMTPSSSHDAGLTSHDNLHKEMLKDKVRDDSYQLCELKLTHKVNVFSSWCLLQIFQ